MSTQNKKKKEKQPKIIRIAIIAKFDDGKCRQVNIDKTTETVVLNAISIFEGHIRVIDTPIEGVDINT